MKSLEPLDHRVTVITAILVVALMTALVLWSSSVFRSGLIVLDETCIGIVAPDFTDLPRGT